ncbi:hypothetical protein, partial [Paracoccus sp. (in: a-proteobacteria)]|uniref:hypothetical protein n=1 Tax=Paracoccus sp. TaxID=267 RepID=UPI00333E1DE8
ESRSKMRVEAGVFQRPVKIFTEVEFSVAFHEHVVDHLRPEVPVRRCAFQLIGNNFSLPAAIIQRPRPLMIKGGHLPSAPVAVSQKCLWFRGAG